MHINGSDRAWAVGAVRSHASAVILVLLPVLAVFGGCTGSGPVFSPVVAPGDDGVVYVYRRNATFEGRDVKVFLDAEYVGALGAGEYVARVVRPGERLVRVERSRETVVVANVARRESVFLEVRAGAFQSRPDLVQRLPEEAWPWLSKLHQAPGVRVAPQAGASSEPGGGG